MDVKRKCMVFPMVLGAGCPYGVLVDQTVPIRHHAPPITQLLDLTVHYCILLRILVSG